MAFNKSLILAHVNARSMRKQETRDLLTVNISENNADVMAVTETWLDTGIADAEVEIPGYTLFRMDRGAGRGCGSLRP